MVFDIDSEDAYDRAEERGCPPPTFIALNRENGHGHAGYLLESPVSAFVRSSRKAMCFYEDVERGLARKLGADPAYAGFLSKNPLSPRWETDWQARIPYRLDTLNDCLDKTDKRRIKRTAMSGIGRNVTVFDFIRANAYRQWLKYTKDGRSAEEFAAFLADEAHGINRTFRPPLHNAEINGIARSVAKWVLDKFSLKRFSDIQAERGRRSWSRTETRSAMKPWTLEGISRSTWYRRQKPQLCLPTELLS